MSLGCGQLIKVEGSCAKFPIVLKPCSVLDKCDTKCMTMTLARVSVMAEAIFTVLLNYNLRFIYNNLQ